MRSRKVGHPPEMIYSGEAAAWATAVGTLLLAIVAVFQDKIRSWLTRPQLKLEIQPSPPDCMKTIFRSVSPTYNNMGQRLGEMSTNIPCYYFRLRVTNTGNCEAREVEVFAKDLKRFKGPKWETVGRFAPMNLLWSNVRKPFLPILSPNIPRHCDVAHVVHPDNRKHVHRALPDVEAPPGFFHLEGQEPCVLALDLEFEPNSLGHLLGPGFYQLSLVLAAANFPPREYLLEIHITGDWFDDEARMFGEAIRLRLK